MHYRPRDYACGTPSVPFKHCLDREMKYEILVQPEDPMMEPRLRMMREGEIGPYSARAICSTVVARHGGSVWTALEMPRTFL